jgi:beta-glucanase (GH16 family)
MAIRTNWREFCGTRYLLVILVFFLGGAAQLHAQCAGVLTSATGSVTWNPTWCQEFNAATAGPPDTTVWAFDLGNGGFGNNEIETYCGPAGYSGNPSNCPTSFSTSTANEYVDGNGHLILQAINSGGTWFSARMKTEKLKDFQYGRIEASIQLPDTTNQGLWPSFWSLGSVIDSGIGWPSCGETDIMEVWSTSVHNGPGPTGNRSTLHTTVTSGNGLQPNGQFTFLSGANDSAFHTYGMIWSANMQQFYIDDPTHPFYIATTSNLPAGDTWPFNAKLFLLTNIAVGGTLGGTPSSSTPNPAVMTYDYIRQYSAAAITAPLMGTPPSITVKAGATTGNSSTFTPTPSASTGYVYFSCSTNAPKASCAIQTSDTLNKYVVNSAVPAETVTVTVTTTANSTASNFPHGPKLSHWMPAVIGFPFLLIAIPSASRMRRVSLYTLILIAVLTLTGMTALSCGGSGGGGGGNNPSPTGNSGTPAGSYTVTVYAFTESNTSNGANANADAHVDIPLTVN